jgi:membrane-bound inhibitor of C-type lysozyme
MFKTCILSPRARACLRTLLAGVALAAAAGCATLTFKAKRETRFVNMDGEFLNVSYGEEKRTETLANGLVCTYDSKVLLRLPDGKKLVLYQAISGTGMRYLSADKHVEFREKGPYCLVARNGRTIFEGVHCRK